MIYIFDIDGTIADLTHRLHFIEKEPKDWDGFFAAVGEDAPIGSVIQVLRALHAAGFTILLASGRSDSVRRKTEVWLHEQGVPYHGLYMRKEGDHRPDNLAKADIFEKEICRDWNRNYIMGVFDDRKQVVDMWRSKGLKVVSGSGGKLLMALIECDRCHQKVEGQIDDDSSWGVYIVEPGWCWHQFANPGENVVCEFCMWKDPRYIKIYGKRATK